MFSLWIRLFFLCSVLCMWTSVECWSYFYSNTTMDWETARIWCKTHYTDMVAIQNQEEIGHLNNWLPRKDNYYWIGIRKIKNIWTWVGTNKSLTAEATNWATGEPNNGKSKVKQRVEKSEDCVEMYIKREQQTGKWNDEWCKNKKTALCYSAACKNNSCLHGECVETINSHRCECTPGFHGDKCQHVVKCNKDEVVAPQNGTVDCLHAYGDFAYNSSCRYFCEEGYQLSTPGPQRCNETGNWTEVSPTCKLVQCQKLFPPSSGSMKCSDPLGPSSYRSTCTFTCAEGYELDEPLSDTLQCESFGKWNASQPSCVAVQCSALEELENGLVTCEDETEMRFSYEKNCSFSCDAGYRLVGPAGVTCTSAAEWSEKTPHCEAITCQKPEAGAHMVTQCSGSELRLDAACSFSCESGFELQGANTTECSEDGRWSEAIPTCKAVQCPALQQPAHSILSCEGDAEMRFSYRNACSFSCESGFELQGANTTECSEDGRWSEATPACKAVQCPALQQPAHSILSCEGDAEMRFSYGNACSFSCAPGYRLMGPSRVVCTAAAEWSEQTAHCEAVTCKFPEAEAPVITKCSKPLTGLGLNSSCSFSCEPGFELQGANATTCTESGHWNEATPTCNAVKCLPLTAPEHGHINCSNQEPVYNSQCSFTCGQDYSLKGQELLICGHHGTWSGENPTCQALSSSATTVAVGVAAGGTALASALSLAMWILKRLRQRASKFELNSNSDIEEPPQVYKNSIDSLI